MARVVVAWECGGHWGHGALVRSAAALLVGAGHEVTLYEPDDSSWGEDGVRGFRRCPLRLEKPVGSGILAGVPWRSRASVLWDEGFGDPKVLRARIELWRTAFEQALPDLLLLHAAPFAQAAARRDDRKVIEFGSGFDVVPLVQPFAPFRGREQFDRGQALALEDAMLTNLGRQADPGRPVGMARLLAPEAQLITSFPELDPYAGTPRGSSSDYVGPLPPVPLAAQRQVEWPSGRRKVLAYVRACNIDLVKLLHELAQLSEATIVVCQDARDIDVATATQLGIVLHRGPVALAPLLPACDIVVCHGGGLVGEALSHGCPVVVMPTQYEQFLTGQAVVRHRVGALVNPALADSYGVGLHHALNDRTVRQSCAFFARRHAGKVASQRFLEWIERAAAPSFLPAR